MSGCLKKLKNAVTRFLETIFYNSRCLEERVRKLEEQVLDLAQCCNNEQNGAEPPMLVEQINVEKISIDKIEFNNNFRSLGIKELSGVLNIGANYGGGALPKKEKGKGQAPTQDKNKQQPKQGEGPECSIHFD